MLALIIVVCITAITTLGTNATSTFSNVALNAAAGQVAAPITTSGWMQSAGGEGSATSVDGRSCSLKRVVRCASSLRRWSAS